MNEELEMRNRKNNQEPTTQYSLLITHLYPDQMNIYGDLGNIITLKKRAEWRDIEVQVSSVGASDKLLAGKTDIYFIGGGQDQDQIEVFADVRKNKAKALKKDLESGVPMLAICGGYQLLGESFLTGDGKTIKGLGIIPAETVAPSTEVAQRCIGNIITKLPEGSPIIKGTKNTLVGFENHSGRTRFISGEVEPLSEVLVGIGDNENAESEGARYLNVFGSYMHGSFLPKNPHMADYILETALKRKYGDEFELKELDDEIEWKAHDTVVKRFS